MKLKNKNIGVIKITILSVFSLFALCSMAGTPKKDKPVIRFKVNSKKIALTFDDGPNPKVTPQLLEILKKYNVKATFFLIGKKIKKSPELINQYLKDGHETGNHSFTHPRLPLLKTEKEIRDEIEENQDLQESMTGKKPVSFRAPFLKFDDRVWKIVHENNLNAYNASCYLDCKDSANVKNHAEEAATKVTPGSIILMHERPITLKFIEKFIKILQREGFEFCTISDLKNSSESK